MSISGCRDESCPTDMIRVVLPHLIATAVVFACLRLAFWQLDRAEEKEQMARQWEQAPAVELATLDTQSAPDFALVQGLGTWDTQRHVMLDNQIRNNHPGVHVFSLFKPLDGGPLLLINRGWQPWLRRSGQWPEIETPDSVVQLTGRLSPPPRVGFQLGAAQALDAENWPNLTTYFDLERVREVFGPEVLDQVVLLSPDHPQHLTGDEWQTIVMGPERHRGYAFQWFSIGSAVFAIWAFLSYRQLRRK